MHVFREGRFRRSGQGERPMCGSSARVNDAQQAISFGLPDNLPIWGSLNGWCRMSCGSCSSRWCPKRRPAPKAEAGAGTGIGRCWPRSCLSSPQTAPGSSCRPHPSVCQELQLTGGLPSGPRPACGRSSTAWSSTSPVLAVSWPGLAARLAPSTCEPCEEHRGKQGPRINLSAEPTSLPLSISTSTPASTTADPLILLCRA